MSELEPTLFRLRVRYVKEGRLRYLGHLEVARTVERSIRRAGLPFAVTQGFSPHMRVAFTAALPVGTSSCCEWYDLILTEYVPASEALRRLEVSTPRDLRPVAAGYRDMRAPTLGILITRQTYRVDLSSPEEPEAVSGALERIVSRGGIDYLRGKKLKRLDLESTLASFSVAGSDGRLTITLDTRSSNAGSLRPEILLAALDAELEGRGAEGPVVSTGMPTLAHFPSFCVERVDQCGWGEGGRIDPLDG